jgi:hypothetical protein
MALSLLNLLLARFDFNQIGSRLPATASGPTSLAFRLAPAGKEPAICPPDRWLIGSGLYADTSQVSNRRVAPAAGLSAGSGAFRNVVVSHLAKAGRGRQSFGQSQQMC